jgi:uncharacterized protein YlxP (DUF503 family)
MPVLDTIRERFSLAASEHANEDLAAVYEVGLTPLSLQAGD